MAATPKRGRHSAEAGRRVLAESKCFAHNEAQAISLAMHDQFEPFDSSRKRELSFDSPRSVQPQRESVEPGTEPICS
jgi:hypothetical protein